MTICRVTPSSVQNHLDQARPGDEIILQAGTYGVPLSMVGRSGITAHPIVVRAEPGAVLDGGVEAEAYCATANRLALDVYEGRVPDVSQGSYPGLWPWMREGQLVLRNCRHVDLVDLAVRRSWPTLIALENAQNIRIAGARLKNGTFAIGALGRDTSAITIDGCDWVQDVVPGRMWTQIAWARIHGDPSDKEPVDIDNDWRLFDGDFFRGDGIRGGVRIRHCRISAAFNAIHLFNDDDILDFGRDVEVAYCTFREIRDNVLEPETCAHNWWFHHNDIVNAHKCFSFEQKRSGHFYVFANRYWVESIQGPDDDTHRGGAVIKAAKSFSPSQGQHYFFHNSLYSRSSYIQKGLLTRFQHQNNAVSFAMPGDPVFDRAVGVFGDLSAPSGDLDGRFTTAWQQLGIAMRDDVVRHETWPNKLRAAGYPIQDGAGGDPGFRDPFHGDFGLRPDSPCRGQAAAMRITLPDGTDWSLPAGGDVGAWQGTTPFQGPEFIATATLTA